MPNKKSSSAKAPVIEDAKPSSKSKKSSNEIDEKKKSSSVKAPVVEDAKPSSKLKKSSNEIDEIFAGKKRKKPEGKKTGKLNNKNETTEPKSVRKRKEKKNKSEEATDGDFADRPVRPRKRTEDGFSIYTEEELGIDKAGAGSTPLCPFDCSCCF